MRLIFTVTLNDSFKISKGISPDLAIKHLKVIDNLKISAIAPLQKPFSAQSAKKCKESNHISLRETNHSSLDLFLVETTRPEEKFLMSFDSKQLIDVYSTNILQFQKLRFQPLSLQSNLSFYVRTIKNNTLKGLFLFPVGIDENGSSFLTVEQNENSNQISLNSWRISFTNTFEKIKATVSSSVMKVLQLDSFTSRSKGEFLLWCYEPEKGNMPLCNHSGSDLKTLKINIGSCCWIVAFRKSAVWSL